MNKKLVVFLFIMGTLISQVVGKEERFKIINLTLKDLEKPIQIGDDKLHIRLYSSDGGKPGTTQIICVVLLNQQKIENDEDLLRHQFFEKQTIPHYYQLELTSGEKYWLSFIKDSRTFRRYTQLVYKPEMHDRCNLQLYFKDFNKNGKDEHLTINIDMNGFDWSGKKSRRGALRQIE